MYQHTIREDKTTNARRRHALACGFSQDKVRSMITRKHNWHNADRQEVRRPERSIGQILAEYDEPTAASL